MIRGAVLTGTLLLALTGLGGLGGLGELASAAPRGLPAGYAWKPMCADHTCRARKLVDAQGTVVAGATPAGITATNIHDAYSLDYSLGSGVTVAVVDAYGYKDLEPDLAVYRAQFGMPACTIASGCLTIVNDNGTTSPLPADDADWIGETALDVDMVSAACPLCKIIVVQSSAGGVGLDIGQVAAVKLGANTISNSWGGPEDDNVTSEEATFNNPGIGTFTGGGDNGYDSVQPGNDGPVYPSTSAHVIAVGGTSLFVSSDSPRGFAEVAWSFGGSSCSGKIPKPAYQPAQAACTMRAATDVSAAADGGSQGIATYVSKQGGWMQVDGTSAASPITAAIFAASGHADAVPAFLYKHPEAFDDITSGQNGSCGTNLCLAGTGWDGPTGLGTPNQAKLAAIGNLAGAGPAVAITYPADGDSLMPGFSIQVAPGSDAAYVTLDVDGTYLGALDADPYTIITPTTLASGSHTITATAFDVDHNSMSAMITVMQGSDSTTGDDGGSGGGGCATGGTGGAPGGLLALGALGVLVAIRRRAS